MPRNNAFNKALRDHGLDKQYRAELDALKAEGLSPRKATIRLQKKYKALVGGGGLSAPALPAEVADRFLAMKGLTNVGDDADWVYEMLGLHTLGPTSQQAVERRLAEAPSAGALGLFRTYAERPRDFYDAYLQRRLPHRTEVDKADASRRSGKAIPELIKSLLAATEEEDADST